MGAWVLLTCALCSSSHKVVIKVAVDHNLRRGPTSEDSLARTLQSLIGLALWPCLWRALQAVSWGCCQSLGATTVFVTLPVHLLRPQSLFPNSSKGHVLLEQAGDVEPHVSYDLGGTPCLCHTCLAVSKSQGHGKSAGCEYGLS